MTKLWKKHHTLDPQIEQFTVGDDHILDLKLIRYDCLASIAHAKMLGKVEILKNNEVEQLCRELENIIDLHEKGKFTISREQEDCHTAIENHLTAKLGDLGKRIHTARSRNDQILTALRLYYLDALIDIQNRIHHLIKALNGFKKQYGKIEFPGYTHTRKAMVSSVALWSQGFIELMQNNLKLIHISQDLIDQSPLGTGAGYGIPLEIDREFTAKIAGFKRIQRNPVAVQNSRGKFESTIVHSLSQIMLDLNRIASDIIFYSLPDLGYFIIPETFCTGSSIMPQKKNPDVLELIRARYHVVLSREFQLKTTIANLTSGYHRDLQLTKRPVFEAFETTQETIEIMALVFKHLKVDDKKCKKGLSEEVFATEKVYELVKQGIPFREAYQKVSKQYE